jgi:hypothetical protein
MKRTSITAIVLGFALSATAAPLSAQAIAGSRVHFGIMGGGTITHGDLSHDAYSGWNAGALVSIGAPLVPVSFRIDGQWHRIDGKSFGGGLLCLGCFPSPATDFRIIDGTVNVVYTLGAALPTKFYLIGGLGVYREHAQIRDSNQTESSTKFGLNAGVGLKLQLSGFATFIEARFHNVFRGMKNGDTGSIIDSARSLQFVPISLGISF